MMGQDRPFSNVGGICQGGNRKPHRVGFVKIALKQSEIRKRLSRMEENHKRAAIKPTNQIENPSPFF